MKNRVIKKIRNTKFMEPFPKFKLGALLIAIFCSFIIVIATFTPVPLRIIAVPEEALLDTVGFFKNLRSFDQITRVLNYIAQIPVIIMIASMLGPRTGILSALFYLVTGFAGFPVFASGGGLGYLSSIRAGYLLGFFAGIFTTGMLLSKKTDRPTVIKAAILGVLAIHIIGITYLTGVLLLKQESIYVIMGWILQLSGVQVLYDLFFGILAAFLGRFLRKALWIVTD